ncbi:hypothetical protein AAFF_G00093250 [Aldrovandia affinis]|uniref:Uncharacterized protein n=1 Tax=Aldrovandia affinis TaxID=143900 RepID=A0AAD7T2N9_9TELE|nr:hypothetical protein AAFF_G00093250 [Aldrovandia affinis]
MSLLLKQVPCGCNVGRAKRGNREAGPSPLFTELRALFPARRLFCGLSQRLPTASSIVFTAELFREEPLSRVLNLSPCVKKWPVCEPEQPHCPGKARVEGRSLRKNESQRRPGSPRSSKLASSGPVTRVGWSRARTSLKERSRAVALTEA